MNVDLTTALAKLSRIDDLGPHDGNVFYLAEDAIDLLETLRNGLIPVAAELIEAAQYDERWAILARMAENVTQGATPS